MKYRKIWMTIILAAVFLGMVHIQVFSVGTKERRVALLDASRDSTERSEEDAWWEEIQGSLPEHVGNEMEKIKKGDVEMGFEYLFSLFLQELKGEGNGFLRLLFTLLGVTALGAVAGMLTDENSPLKRSLNLILSATMALTLWGMFSHTLARVWVCLDDLARFSEGLVPVMTAILAGGGAGNGAATGAAGLTTLFAVLEVLVGRVLSPLIAVCFAFSLVGACSDEVHIDGIAGNLKGIYMTILGVVGMVATGAITLQSVLAASADSMAMRTARYTVGNIIPIVGGTIGAALGTLGSSLTVIKSSVGVGAIVACLILILPLVISLYLTRLSMNLSAALARMMNFKIGERLLNDFRGVVDMTLAATALSGTLFIIYIAVFLKTALPFAA